VYVIGTAPVYEPTLVRVRVEPTDSLPEITGATVLTGADGGPDVFVPFTDMPMLICMAYQRAKILVAVVFVL